MKLRVNGKDTDVEAADLQALLDELGYAEARVATARNGVIVHKDDRAKTELQTGDAIEIVAPMQGG